MGGCPTFLLTLLRRLVASFHPRTMPALSRRNYQREVLGAAFFFVGVAVIEGGVVSVIVRKGYESALPVAGLNFIVGLLASAPEWANLLSFFWAAVAHGRDKIRVITVLHAAVLLAIAVMALAPRTAWGVWVVIACVFSARVCMAGVVTLRATVWRANYPRHERPRIAGKIATIQALVLAGVALALGAGKDVSDLVYRVLMLAAAGTAEVGVVIYSRIRLRGRRRLLRLERHASHRPTFNPLRHLHILRDDRHYAAFQLWMSVLGAGNLLLVAPLAIFLRERMQMEAVDSIVVIYALPHLVMPWAIPYWSRRLARRHVVRFRARHSWVFVVAQGLIFLAAAAHQPALLYLGSVLLGVGFAGGTLAWNLGHLDFAPAHRATDYMAVHVMLNGVRGLVAPLTGVALYEVLKATGSGREHWVFALSVVLCAAGAIGFGRLARRMGPAAALPPREEVSPAIPGTLAR